MIKRASIDRGAPAGILAAVTDGRIRAEGAPPLDTIAGSPRMLPATRPEGAPADAATRRPPPHRKHGPSACGRPATVRPLPPQAPLPPPGARKAGRSRRSARSLQVTGSAPGSPRGSAAPRIGGWAQARAHKDGHVGCETNQVVWVVRTPIAKQLNTTRGAARREGRQQLTRHSAERGGPCAAGAAATAGDGRARRSLCRRPVRRGVRPGPPVQPVPGGRRL